jgi:hypothetical protein
MKKRNGCAALILAAAVVLTGFGVACGQDGSAQVPFKLARAVMCETVQGYSPINVAVVFSIELGRVSCFTAFDPVDQKTTIHHKWYRRGDLVTIKRLTVNPPRWSSVSSIQLRDADKGPWRVDITDEHESVIHTLRFSITD